MTKNKTMADDIREEINYQLYSFGLQIEGASKASRGRWWITLKKTCATYNMQKVANLLMSILDVNAIVLDGKTFRRSRNFA